MAIDLRTKEGKVHKASLMGQAIELRELGWQIDAIAATLDVSPATVSSWLPRHLAVLNHRVLKDRRDAIRRGENHVEVTARRVANQDNRAQRRIRERLQARGVARPVSLDEVIHVSSQSLRGLPLTYADVIADKNAEPHAHVERQMLDEIVGDLSVEDVSRLPEAALMQLQRRLSEAGFGPGGVQAKERERLRTPEPHRGNAPSATSSRMAPRHRSRDAQKTLMKGKRTSRKQPKRWDRGRVEY